MATGCVLGTSLRQPGLQANQFVASANQSIVKG